MARGHRADVRSLPARKRALRSRALALRAALAASPPRDAVSRAGTRILREVAHTNSPRIAGFWPLGSEFDCRAILAALYAHGYRCCLPVVVARDAPLRFRQWRPDTQLLPGAYGELIPGTEAEAVDPDLLLVPGLAFDPRGYRLGYGAGYYDRTLAALRARKPIRALGLAYAGQLVAAVPHGDTDEPVDGVITEAATLRCKTRTSQDAHSGA